jgi:hypothetical protein
MLKFTEPSNVWNLYERIESSVVRLRIEGNFLRISTRESKD